MTNDILTEILENWKIDSSFDPAALDKESLKINGKHHKYLLYYNRLMKRKISLKHKYMTMKREKNYFYSGKGNATVYKDNPFEYKLMKSDIPEYVNTDSEILKLEQEMETINLYLENVTQILNMIKNMNFQIKNAIEYQRFINGSI